MNRIDRLSAILVQLQSRSLIKAQQISDRFNVSLRTVYRDIRALEEAGIPIVGNPGIGYSLVDGYKLPPLMFTQTEAFAFLIAEKLVNELTDSDSSKYYKSGMDKIRAVMRLADKDSLESMETNMGILKTLKCKVSDSESKLQLLLQSIHEKKILRISYFTDYKKDFSERDVEPIGVFFSRTNWYLVAFCQIKNAYRTFRVDRIQRIDHIEGTFTKRHPPLKDFLNEVSKTEKLDEIVVRVEKDNISMIDNDKYYYGLFSEKEIEDYIELSFLTFSLDKFARWYLSFADVAKIISPVSLKNMIKEILENILCNNE